jgi:hypothetical protein
VKEFNDQFLFHVILPKSRSSVFAFVFQSLFFARGLTLSFHQTTCSSFTFEEQKRENVLLKICRVSQSAQDVGGSPEMGFEFFGVHKIVFSLIIPIYIYKTMCRKAENLFDFTKIRVENQTKKAPENSGAFEHPFIGMYLFFV